MRKQGVQDNSLSVWIEGYAGFVAGVVQDNYHASLQCEFWRIYHTISQSNPCSKLPLPLEGDRQPHLPTVPTTPSSPKA